MDRFGQSLSPYLQGNMPGAIPRGVPPIGGFPMGEVPLLERSQPPNMQDALKVITMLRPDFLSSMLNAGQPPTQPQNAPGATPNGNIFEAIKGMDPNTMRATKEYLSAWEKIRKLESGEMPGQGAQRPGQGPQRPGARPVGARPRPTAQAKPAGGQQSPFTPTYQATPPPGRTVQRAPMSPQTPQSPPEAGMMNAGQQEGGTMQGQNNMLATLLQGMGGPQRQGGQYLPDMQNAAMKRQQIQQLMAAMGGGGAGGPMARQLPTGSLSALLNGGMM